MKFFFPFHRDEIGSSHKKNRNAWLINNLDNLLGGAKTIFFSWLFCHNFISLVWACLWDALFALYSFLAMQIDGRHSSYGIYVYSFFLFYLIPFFLSIYTFPITSFIIYINFFFIFFFISFPPQNGMDFYHFQLI